MNGLTLVIGNKNYSSWSLRSWLALKLTGQPFREVKISLRQPETRNRILAFSPAGKVPVLLDGDRVLWETIAINEYLAERFPEARLWPADPAARALARAVSAEMHAGFAAMRNELSMDMRSRLVRTPGPEAAADVARVQAIWRDCRERFGRGGAFLFGDPTIADAMFAPVVTRFRTYGVSMDPVSAAYAEAVLALPAMQEWDAAAAVEAEVLD